MPGDHMLICAAACLQRARRTEKLRRAARGSGQASGPESTQGVLLLELVRAHQPDTRRPCFWSRTRASVSSRPPASPTSRARVLSRGAGGLVVELQPSRRHQVHQQRQAPGAVEDQVLAPAPDARPTVLAGQIESGGSNVFNALTRRPCVLDQLARQRRRPARRAVISTSGSSGIPTHRRGPEPAGNRLSVGGDRRSFVPDARWAVPAHVPVLACHLRAERPVAEACWS